MHATKKRDILWEIHVYSIHLVVTAYCTAFRERRIDRQGFYPNFIFLLHKKAGFHSSETQYMKNPDQTVL